MFDEPKRETPPPTKAELNIMGVLWRLGPSTVRCVHEAMPADSTTGYTTILKLLQIMHRKGLVERDDSRRAHVYQTVRPKEEVQEQLTSDLIHRAFGGSTSQLVLQALGHTATASPAELAQIRQLLSDLEQKTT